MVKDRKILLGVDLEKSIEVALTREIIAHTYFEVSDCVTEGYLNSLQEMKEGETADLYLLVRRRLINDHRATQVATDRISEIGAQLADLGVTDALDKVILVDTAERPTPPLSDPMVLAEYMECIARDVAGEALGFIFALDYDLSYDTEIRIHTHDLSINDTRSDEFAKIYAQYALDTLHGLNQNFGQSTLPKVGSGSIENIDETIRHALEKLSRS